VKTLVQCDFDGTISEKDVSFALLDTFANGDWRKLFGQYKAGKISVGRFNTEAFAMVKTDKESLLEVVRDKTKIRPGFRELVALCDRKGFRLVIVSNGLDFYINAILEDIGMNNIEVFAAKTEFRPQGIKVQYIGPDGGSLDEDFKKAYASSFLRSDYRIIYVGNGTSDILPAKLAYHIFATGDLLSLCKEMGLSCTPFNDLNDVVGNLELL
jgi:2-hydroxy-3-keto-5-methylthiopentenyl-1-phosphate phosphatase